MSGKWCTPQRRLLDPWVERAFTPSNLQHTLRALADAQHSSLDQNKAQIARDKLAICNAKLERYRAALEAGTDPSLVQQWIAETKAQTSIAESELKALSGAALHDARRDPTLVEAMSGIAAILQAADPADKAELYRELGLRLTYEPGLRLINAEASPS